MEIKLINFNLAFLKLSNLWINDEEINQLIDAQKVSYEEQLNWFQRLENRKDYRIWGILYNNHMIGACGLKNISEIKAEYFGYIGEKEYWGKGLGQKIIQQTIDKAIELNLKKINLFVKKENFIAIKSYKKFGFVEIGITKDKIEMKYKLC